MSVGKFLKAWQESRPELTALIGHRFYPGGVPVGDTEPYATYQVIDNPPAQTLRGPGGVTHATVQIDCVSRSYATAQDIALAFKGVRGATALDGFIGAAGGVTVQGCKCLSVRDDYLDPAAGEGMGWHRTSMDFSVWYTEGT